VIRTLHAENKFVAVSSQERTARVLDSFGQSSDIVLTRAGRWKTRKKNANSVSSPLIRRSSSGFEPRTQSPYEKKGQLLTRDEMKGLKTLGSQIDILNHHY
jgi:hypothetical protein